MNAYPNILSDLEQTISTIEETASVPSGEPAVHPHVSVAWICPDPSDIWPLIASLSPENVKVVSRKTVGQHARSIPLTLRFSKHTKLDLHFTKTKGKPGFQAFESLGADLSKALKNIEAGLLTIGTGQQQPFDITGIKKLIGFLQEIYIDRPDDFSSFIESVTFEAPLDNLNGTEVAVTVPGSVPAADVIWIVLSADIAHGQDLKALKKAVDRGKPPLIMPVLGFPWHYLSESAESGDPGRLLHETADALARSGIKDALPVLPLYRDSFIPGETPGGVYAFRCMDLLWRTTRTAGFEVSAWKGAIIERYNSLITAQMETPESVLGLLRQHALLKALNTIEIPIFDSPDIKQFEKIQAEGEKSYGDIAGKAAALRKKRAEEAKQSAIAEAVDAAATTFSKALDTLNSAGCFAEDGEEIDRIKSKLPDVTASADISAFKKNIGSAEILFDTAGQRLNERESNLAAIDKELEKKRSETSDDKTSEREEALEQVEQFWNDFVPATLRAVQYKMPQNDIDKILKKTLADYNKYLKLTPYDENEFLKCITIEWPKHAAECMEKINPLLDDTVNLWTATIEQELGRLEDFRKDKFPKGQAISDTIAVKSRVHPKLKTKLTTTIPKKPGLFGNLLASKEDQDKWHSDTISKLHNEATECIKSYQIDITNWLKQTIDQYKTAITNVISTASKVAETARKKREDIQSGYMETLKDIKRLDTELTEGNKILEAHRKELENMKNMWLKEREHILKSIDIDTIDIQRSGS